MFFVTSEESRMQAMKFIQFFSKKIHSYKNPKFLTQNK